MMKISFKHNLEFCVKNIFMKWFLVRKLFINIMIDKYGVKFYQISYKIDAIVVMKEKEEKEVMIKILINNINLKWYVKDKMVNQKNLQ